jgi:predicted DCC family thiol-disulfide oxidoreductase YuxK
LFDGVCALCNASVNFIIDHDPARRFQFEPLQSARGRSLLVQHHLDPTRIHSLVLIESGHAYVKSTAALRIARNLGWPLALLAWLVVVPAPVRDAVYDWIAVNRYRWFGRIDEPVCRIDRRNK